jgi:hypothetical protein
MDIAGAKALKERLGHQSRDDASSGPVHVPEDAPPVYHYLGVSETPAEPRAPAPQKAAEEQRRSWLRRLRPSGREAC